MKGSDTAKIGFVIVALGVAGYLMLGMFKSDPMDQTLEWRICANAACNAEYSYPVSELKAAAREKRTLPCPHCGSEERIAAFGCEQCKKATPGEIHGAIPKECRHCKAQFPRPKLPGAK